MNNSLEYIRLVVEALKLDTEIFIYKNNFHRLVTECKYSPDQPRDDHGRWTSGGDADSEDSGDHGSDILSSASDVLDIFSAASGDLLNSLLSAGTDEPDSSDETIDGGSGNDSITAPDSWARPETLQNHYERHGPD